MIMASVIKAMCRTAQDFHELSQSYNPRKFCAVQHYTIASRPPAMGNHKIKNRKQIDEIVQLNMQSREGNAMSCNYDVLRIMFCVASLANHTHTLPLLWLGWNVLVFF